MPDCHGPHDLNSNLDAAAVAGSGFVGSLYLSNLN